MDLQLLTVKVGERAYHSVDEFMTDVTLLYDNAKKYATKKWPNVARSADNVVKRAAKECEKLREAQAAASQRIDNVNDVNENNNNNGNNNVDAKLEAHVDDDDRDGHRVFDIEISPSALLTNATGGIEFLQELPVYHKLMMSGAQWCTNLGARFCTSLDDEDASDNK
jgi:hypothetical protein